ncbi:MAG: Eco57I restriction-modification methylase domain-containing protein, partial [Bacteroidota bacterium]
ESSLQNLKFFEIDGQMHDHLLVNVKRRLAQLGCNLPKEMIEKGDFLTSQLDKVDIIIGNPPYVRHENIPTENKAIYRKEFGTFTHRSDLYIAFFEKGLKCLKQDGQLSFICSNRWLKNQYGERLRNYIHHGYNLIDVLDLEESSPFEEEVIAYPAIINIRNSHKKQKSKYFKIDDIESLKSFSRKNSADRILSTSNPNWFHSVDYGESYNKFLSSIESQGFKIGIGVATGCDKVFIRKDFKEIVEDELILPILTSRDIRNNNLNWGGNYILNPFDKNGNLIDLEKYPKALSYFNTNSEILKKRHVAKKNEEKWFKTIDKINHQLTFESKIILPDISGNSHIFIDEGNYYPHHNLYYIKGRSENDLTILASILMSDFVRDQLMEFGNKMNGGYPRWQSQNLRKLQLPLVKAIPELTRIELINAYANRDIQTINSLITVENISEYEVTSGQTVLFEPDESKTYAIKSKRHESTTDAKNEYAKQAI